MKACWCCEARPLLSWENYIFQVFPDSKPSTVLVCLKAWGDLGLGTLGTGWWRCFCLLRVRFRCFLNGYNLSACDLMHQRKFG
jgi:hypothetical protein